MAGIAQKLQKILEGLLKRVPDVERAAVVSSEGLMMMSVPEGEDEEILAALSSALLFQGERVVDELRKGQMEQVFVKGSEGYVVVENLGEDAALVVVTRPGGKLGLLFLELKFTVRELKQALEAEMREMEGQSGGEEESVEAVEELGSPELDEMKGDVTTLEDLEKEGEGDFFGA